MNGISFINAAIKREVIVVDIFACCIKKRTGWKACPTLEK